jgi:hypothetical protein
MPVIRRNLWWTYSPCVFYLHARLWVRSAHLAFPAPSHLRANDTHNPGASRRGNAEVRHSGARMARVRNTGLFDVLGNTAVMAGLDPAIHVLLFCFVQDVDARHKAGHDEK